MGIVVDFDGDAVLGASNMPWEPPASGAKNLPVLAVDADGISRYLTKLLTKCLTDCCLRR